MLFISNPHTSNGTINYHDQDQYSVPQDCTQRWNIIKLVITAVFFYVVTSVFSVILYYPISCCLLILPLIVLVYTILVLKGYNRRCLWPSIIIGLAGFSLKIIVIIVFCSIFPVQYESIASNTTDQYSPEIDDKTVFIGIACGIELAIIVLSCSFLWLVASNCNNANKGRHIQQL